MPVIIGKCFIHHIVAYPAFCFYIADKSAAEMVNCSGFTVADIIGNCNSITFKFIYNNIGWKFYFLPRNIKPGICQARVKPYTFFSASISEGETTISGIFSSTFSLRNFIILSMYYLKKSILFIKFYLEISIGDLHSKVILFVHTQPATGFIDIKCELVFKFE